MVPVHLSRRAGESVSSCSIPRSNPDSPVFPSPDLGAVAMMVDPPLLGSSSYSLFQSGVQGSTATYEPAIAAETTSQFCNWVTDVILQHGGMMTYVRLFRRRDLRRLGLSSTFRCSSRCVLIAVLMSVCLSSRISVSDGSLFRREINQQPVCVLRN